MSTKLSHLRELARKNYENPENLTEPPKWDPNSDNNQAHLNGFVRHSPVKTFTIQPPIAVVLSLVFGVLLCSILIFVAYKRVRKTTRKLKELKCLTPQNDCNLSAVTNARLTLGIKPDQSIEFVVPTITLPETTPYSMTEDSFTDSDYLPFNSHSDREYSPNCANFSRGRQRHLTGQSSLSVNDISRRFYDCSGESEDVAGKVNFALHYSIHRQQLLITLLSATDLLVSGRKGSINPQAKVVLLPEKAPKFVTKVHRNNPNPVFNEMFIFSARKETLDERRLRISIWDSDRFSRKFFVGQVVYSLSESKITSSITSDVVTEEILCTLSRQKSTSSTGEMAVSLLFNPEIATLTVTVNKARGLMVKDISTVYLKVSLYVGKKRVGSKKSPIRKAYSFVEFNDSFHVHVKDSAVDSVNIVISLVGRSSIGLNAKHKLGKIYIGENCFSSDGANHWAEILKNKGNSVVKWHTLV